MDIREYSAVYFTLPFIGDAWLPLEVAAGITLLWFGYLRFVVWLLFELPHHRAATEFTLEVLDSVRVINHDESA